MKSHLQNNNYVFKITKRIKNIVTQKQGFSLIESLFALFIQFVIVMLIPIIIVTLGQLKNTIFEDRTFDIEIMVKDMENVIHANDVKQQMISNKTMMIQRDNVLVNYRFQNKKIIKTINHHGNITMLNNVQDVHYQEIDHHMILMTIKYKEGAILHVKEVLL